MKIRITLDDLLTGDLPVEFGEGVTTSTTDSTSTTRIERPDGTSTIIVTTGKSSARTEVTKRAAPS